MGFPIVEGRESSLTLEIPFGLRSMAIPTVFNDDELLKFSENEER